MLAAQRDARMPAGGGACEVGSLHDRHMPQYFICDQATEPCNETLLHAARAPPSFSAVLLPGVPPAACLLPTCRFHFDLLRRCV